jgi:hypothetical protein
MRMWGNSSSSGVRSSAEPPEDADEDEPLAKSCWGIAFRESELNILRPAFGLAASGERGPLSLDEGASGLSARLETKTEDMRRMLVVVGNAKSEVCKRRRR